MARVEKPGQEWGRETAPGLVYDEEAFERFPCERGEVWAVGDKALVAVGDLAMDDPMAFRAFAAARGWVPNATHTDPPWDKGNAATFRTKTFGKEHAAKVDFLGELVPQILDTLVGACLIEMGCKHTDDVIAQVQARWGDIAIEVVPITYYKKHPCRLISFCIDDGPRISVESLAGLDDEHMVAPMADLLIQARGDLLLWDCCTGRGTIPKKVIEQGGRFLGTELNPRRMAVTLKKLAETVGVEPVVVGNYLEG